MNPKTDQKSATMTPHDLTTSTIPPALIVVWQTNAHWKQYYFATLILPMGGCALTSATHCAGGLTAVPYAAMYFLVKIGREND